MLVAKAAQDKQITDFLGNGVMGRSFLILGPKESGKTYFGKYFASRILDNRVFSGTHPDFVYFRGSSSGYIDTVNSFIESSLKQPFEYKTIVLFYDSLDLVPDIGLNKLLKTLEEPPLKTVIIISANSVDSLLDTVVSRCFKIHLRDFTLKEKAIILKHYGIPDADLKISISKSLKLSMSADFDQLFERIKSNRKSFKALLSAKEADFWPLLEELIKEDMNVSEFLDSLLGWTGIFEFEQEVIKRKARSEAFGNQYVLLADFLITARNGFKGIAEIPEIKTAFD